MRPHRVSSLLVAAVSFASLASTSRAQATDSSTVGGSPIVAFTASPWGARPLGRYELEVRLPDRVMPALVTVFDSADGLAGTIWPEGDRDPLPVAVAVRDAELVLSAEAPLGHVRFVLQRDGERIRGTWAMGEQHGALEGKVAR